MGAIYKNSDSKSAQDGVGPDCWNAIESIKKTLGNEWRAGNASVFSFNDSPDTKFSDIKRVVKGAIKRERACGN